MVQKELKEEQEKSEKTAKAVVAEHPCPFCGQEMPEDYVKPDNKDVTLNLTDATKFGQLQAKLERTNNKAKASNESRSSLLMDIAEKYNLFDPSVGYDRNKRCLLYADANGKRIPFEGVKLTDDECKKIEQITWEMTRTAINAQKAATEVEAFANDLAERYHWIYHPFDIRKGKFVEVTDEILKQREAQLEQARARAKQIMEPEFKE